MMQVVPDSEITVGDKIEFAFNGRKYQSIITNSSVDNNLIVWIKGEDELIDIALNNVSDIKRLEKGPWHNIVCKLDDPIITEASKSYIQ